MKISAIVLVGNFEPYLEYCIKSLEPIVDEIVLLTEVGYKYGGLKESFKINKIKEIEQCEHETDFSKWRNKALEHCTGEYIIRLDADEVLANLDGKPVTRKRLEELCKVIKNEKLACVDLFTRHFMYNYFTVDGRNNGMHFTKGFLFRKKDVKGYKGKIHEHLDFKEGVPGVASSNMGPCIYHFGHCKGMENLREKYRRSMDVPDNPFKRHYDNLKCKNVDEYCAKHNIFKGTLPLIKYDGPLPKIMRLW